VQKTVLILLTAVIAVSGCTEEIATQEDLRQQTSELKQHTSESLEKDNELVSRYRIGNIEIQAQCLNMSSDGESVIGLGDRLSLQIFDRDSSVQEFLNGRYLVENGLRLDEVEVSDCRPGLKLQEISIREVEYNKTVFQNGAEISSGPKSCEVYERIDVDEAYSFEIEEDLIEVGKKIYTECLGIRLSRGNLLKEVIIGEQVEVC